METEPAAAIVAKAKTMAGPPAQGGGVHALLQACGQPQEEPGELDAVEAEAAEDFAPQRRQHLEQIADIVKAVPVSTATTRIPSGRRVDTVGDDGERKSRWTTRGFEQALLGNETHVAGTPGMAHLKALLVDAARQNTAVALGD